MKNIIRITLALLLLLVVIILVKTLSYKSPVFQSYQAVEIDVDSSAVNRFQGAIQIPTISYPDRADTAVMLAFHAYLKAEFPLVHEHLEVETFNDLSLIYKWKAENSTSDPALFLAHMDVVPIDSSTASLWQFDPFSGREKDGFILGRGTLDDKGSVLGILEAAEMLLVEGFQPKESIYFAFGHDEEIGGKDGAVKIAETFEQQGQRFSFIIDEGLVVVTDGLSGIDKPIGLIGLAEKGAMSMKLSVQMENGGHAMMPPKKPLLLS